MNDPHITLSSLATVVAISAAIFGIIMQGLKLLVEFLTAKFGKGSSVQEEPSYDMERHIFNQGKMESVLISQNKNIEKMLEHNGRQIEALANMSHQAELRHQIVIAKLDRIETLQTR